MGIGVSAVTGIGSAISVVVPTLEAAKLKALEFRDDGFTQIVVKTLDGVLVNPDELKGASAD